MDIAAQLPPPFDLCAEGAYQRWREQKLADYPADIEALTVAISDPRCLSRKEADALWWCIARTNMALYRSAVGAEEDPGIPRLLAARFGLQQLDSNYLAEDDGISAITVSASGARQRYIPYTDRAIRWHTDGYYNPAPRTVRAMLLHCVRPAAEGGDNSLLDPEIVYILLRDRNPDFIRALSHPQAMTIPAGTGGEGGARPAIAGPVFSVAEDGSLQMRFTARRHNVLWRDDELTCQALSVLFDLLAGDLPYIFRLRLESGMGLLSNNVLHAREAFRDKVGAPPRLLYRARYYQRIQQPGADC